jgi:hypothetical protein
LASRLLLFPIVAMLPAPRWARAAGYGWLVAADIATVQDVVLAPVSGLVFRRVAIYGIRARRKIARLLSGESSESIA